ncbi:YchF/TatD family DNA exonuclease [Enterococcus hirae]|uniref:TatD family hydrolase n=1 Tax=Enterococcus hirae TaxID=1354 RepID=UPI0013736E4C|nr:TatD family hydrolase [Enterococcus hirae]NBA20938.1 YchF/TatD family DNA exonuclease [Enterococcus hirae]NBA27380.1 YchF/TatD family DNA exonuclease [Enterococcus hirae]NBA34114.1 YchF/TatD family DNA exonuclease [Enterococcus hirae]NBA36631.1 YchF/TatD family DNA exonuclease [Enterococcus hirae]NBA42149.1 YchF/TatD family DNA exonuclease [Enterococcus hirae]
MIFDSHTHLNAEQFNDDIPETIERAKELGVTKMAVVGFDTPTIEKSLQLSHDYSNIYSIIGWHPTEAGSYTKDIEKKLQEQLTMPKVVALGEIGLDYYWMEDPKEVQAEVFRRQIAIAKEMNLPISIHTREALADTYQILKEEDIRDIGGIMHSFSGDFEWAKRFLDLGMHISFSGVVTFKKAQDVQEAATHVPLDRLLVETDAPYLAPVPYRGKRNEPGYTRFTVEKIAELRNLPIEEVALQTWKNAHRLFRIAEND